MWPDVVLAMGAIGRYVVAGGQSWAWQVYWAVFAHTQWPCAYAHSEASLRRVLAERPARYVFFVHWSSFVVPAITDAYECVNFHCTALPYGRGGHPIENLILRGATETVLTAYRMTEELDAGPIYAVSPPVSLAGSKEAILRRFVEPVADLMRYIIETEPLPRPQVGAVERFHRLPIAEAEALWASRS